MSNSQPSNTRFWIIAAIALVTAVAGVAALCPLILSTARYESDQLVGEARQTNGGEAQVDYQLATWLNSSNTAAYLGLAQIQISAAQPDDALRTLDRAGEGSEVENLKVRTLLELSRNSAAANEAIHLTSASATTNDLLLASLADIQADRPADARALVPRLTAPEALQRVQRALTGGTPLASELYATGLLKSSSALLVKLPTSFERNLLLARILYTWHTPNDLKQASDYLSIAVALNPTSIEAHQLYATVLRDTGNPMAATDQDTLVMKLQSGRP